MDAFDISNPKKMLVAVLGVGVGLVLILAIAGLGAMGLSAIGVNVPFFG